MLQTLGRLAAFILGVILLAAMFATPGQHGPAVAMLNVIGAVLGALVAWVYQRRKGRRLTRKVGAAGIALGALVSGLAPVAVGTLTVGPFQLSPELVGETLGKSIVNALFLSVFAVAFFGKGARADNAQPTRQTAGSAGV